LQPPEYGTTVNLRRNSLGSHMTGLGHSRPIRPFLTNGRGPLRSESDQNVALP
jgi:hypothetical protein